MVGSAAVPFTHFETINPIMHPHNQCNVQAAQRIDKLSPQHKIEWATHQRKEGNALFANGSYQEAMDVYLTCLVAMEPSSRAKDVIVTNTETAIVSTTEEQQLKLKLQNETEIQLPVLLNLSLCALKIGAHSKAEKFLNFALELDCGKSSVKAYFRRGRVRMLMGNYVSAELDMEKALDLLESGEDTTIVGEKPKMNEKEVILKEKLKLQRLVGRAEKNRRQQKKAMERLFKSDDDASPQQSTSNNVHGEPISTKEVFSLYPEKKVAPKQQHSNTNTGNALEACQPSCFQWYLRMIGRCAQKLLDIIGEEDHDNDSEKVDPSEVLVEQMLKSNTKKNL